MYVFVFKLRQLSAFCYYIICLKGGNVARLWSRRASCDRCTSARTRMSAYFSVFTTCTVVTQATDINRPLRQVPYRTSFMPRPSMTSQLVCSYSVHSAKVTVVSTSGSRRRRFWGAHATLRKATTSFAMPDRLSVTLRRTNSAPIWPIFTEFYI
jgi:hypothetical protein